MNMKLHDSSFTPIKNGKKTNTIRAGYRNVPLGYMWFDATHNTVPSIEVDVVSTKSCVFRELDWDDLKNVGTFDVDGNLSLDANLQTYLSHLQKIYPNMTMDGDITVINFTYTP